MPTVDLTARLVRDSRPGAGDTILFDRALPGFGLRIHPSGRKVYIVQARIDGRSRRMVIARHSDMDLAEARRRARDVLARIRARVLAQSDNVPFRTKLRCPLSGRKGGKRLLKTEEGMTMREVDRLGVIREVAGKRLRQREGGERMGLSVRQVKRLLRRYRELGARGLISGHGGRKANNAIAPEVRAEILGVVRERYEDFHRPWPGRS